VISNKLDIDDPEQYRGIMNGPWVLFGAPFAALGIIEIVQYVVWQRRRGIAAQLMIRRNQLPGAGVVAAAEIAAAGVPAAIIGYCLVWLAVTVYLWDFSRWRLPVVPALTLAAVWGFTTTSTAWRALTFGGWLILLSGYWLLQA
jgi:hypothetical protein